MASGAPLAPVASESTSGTPTSTTPGANPPTRGPRGAALLVIAVIVVAVVLAAALLLSGVILHSSSNPSASTGSALTFSEARNLAEPTGGSTGGGPWSLFSASGFDVNRTISSQFAVPGLACFGPGTTHFLTTARPEIPAFNGSLALGLSPFWIFSFSNGTTSAHNQTNLLVVLVVNGTATAFATINTPCVLGIPNPLPSSGFLDSPAALTDSLATNTSFFVAHPHLNATFQIQELGRGVGPEWGASFTTCAPFEQFFTSNSTSYPGYSYDVGLNATTGTQLGYTIPGSATCSSIG
jgi:hypothetical protein